jgi:3',5'-cyclic AMP phosphodiesterase CpdA
MRLSLLSIAMGALACGPTRGADGALDSGDATVADGDDGASDGADGAAISEPPYGEDLVQGGGFEDPALPAWEVDGACQVVQSSEALGPPEGDRFLRGAVGQEPVVDCVVAQGWDLSEAGFDLAAIDAGRVAVEVEGLLANRGPAGSFDDQVRLRVRYLDAAAAALGSLETLVAGDGSWVLRGATGLLPPGTRGLRLEVEQRFRAPPDNDGYADDVGLSLREVVPASPALTLEPLLQDHRPDAMTLAWETDGAPAAHAVRYGAVGGALDRSQPVVRTLAVDDQHHVHVAELTDGLSAGAAFDYEVDSGGVTSGRHSFRTAPVPDAPVSIAWLADNQEGWERFRTHLTHLAARAPDLLVVPGDIVSDPNVLDEWREWWWGSLVDTAAFGSNTPVLVARGNHDRHHPYAYAYAQLPDNEIFYSFRYGPVFVVALDSQSAVAHMPDEIDQLAFLEAALSSEAARTADFRVVTFHQAPFTNSVQNDTTGHEGSREHWVPLFADHDVDMVISGHFHSYQRGELDGVQYVIVGGGGSHLLVDVYDFWEHMTVLEQTWHYALMDVADGQLVWEVRDLDDRVIDRLTLTAGD